MTDLTPNDLSHMSDKDFNALAPQGHHAPGSEPLSPAAQAIIDAIGISPGSSFYAWIAAAALRAAADYAQRSTYAATPSTDWDDGWEAGVLDTTGGLLSIAAELEGQ